MISIRPLGVPQPVRLGVGAEVLEERVVRPSSAGSSQLAGRPELVERRHVDAASSPLSRQLVVEVLQPLARRAALGELVADAEPLGQRRRRSS